MAKTLSKLILAGAAASLAFAPIAAQAGTRAGDNGQVYTAANAQPGMGRAAEGEDFAGGLNAFHLLIFVYVAAWTTGFIIKVTDDDEDDFAQSPGV